MSMFDINLIRNDFPILARKIHNKPLVYLDNAATSQKPKQVIQALVNYYEQHNANVHRGIHVLGDEATKLYAEARQTVSKFIGANHPSELVFVRNTTEAINLVAYAWGQDNVHKGDLVLTTRMEHHSNIVPWQELVRRVGARLEFVEVTHEGLLDLDDLDKKLRLKPRLVTFTHVSNFLGTINPVSQIVSLIKKRSRDTYIMVDGAQAVPHFSVQVGELGVDFYAFS
jgi:cysteine desulfurase/selenocysteine lyase